MNNQTYSSVIGVVALTGLLGALGCAGVKEKGSSTGSAATGGTSGAGLSTGTAGTGVMPTACSGKCTDFPTDPINTNIPAIDPGMFGAPSGAGPCVTEPEDGSLFPNNWLRPRVRVPGASYMKITVHADMEANDLVAYASGETWKMPANIWKGLAGHVVQQPVSVTVQPARMAMKPAGHEIAATCRNQRVVSSRRRHQSHAPHSAVAIIRKPSPTMMRKA